MILIGISGRKGSGKSTVTHFLLRNAAKLFGDGSGAYATAFDAVGRESISYQNSGRKLRVRAYAMADQLKKFCTDMLGLSEAQVYGTDSQKDELTRYSWEQMPHWPRLVEEARQKARREVAEERNGRWWPERLFLKLTKADEIEAENRAWLRIPMGRMTARAVMQQWGSDIFRRLYGDIHRDACLRQIRKDAPDVAFIDDIRFENEVVGVQQEGGVVLRLARAPYRADEHSSETALDSFDPHRFDATIPGDLSERDALETVLYVLGKHEYGLWLCNGCKAADLNWPPYTAESGGPAGKVSIGVDPASGPDQTATVVARWEDEDLRREFRARLYVEELKA